MSRRKAKSPVRRYHDRVARRYDASYDDAYWQWHDALTWDYVKPHLPRNQADPLLDLGCGTGKWGMRLLAAGFPVTLVDVSGAMIEQARKKIEAARLERRASFCQADLHDLAELPDAAFALAVAMGEPLGCAGSPPRALSQIRRKLRPGGTLIATLDNRLAALDYYLERGDLGDLTRFLQTGRTHWLTDNPAEQFEIWTATPAQAAALFTKAGLEIVEIRGKTVLPMRLYRHLLDDPPARRTLAAVERKLARDPAGVGRAAHLQITARRPPV
jgi:ubiquinone/menaquinone biosynthesis C-methylase UbiE